MPWLHALLSGALYTATTRAPAVKASPPPSAAIRSPVCTVKALPSTEAPHWAVMSVQPFAGSVPTRPSLPAETASKPPSAPAATYTRMLAGTLEGSSPALMVSTNCTV